MPESRGLLGLVVPRLWVALAACADCSLTIEEVLDRDGHQPGKAGALIVRHVVLKLGIMEVAVCEHAARFHNISLVFVDMGGCQNYGPFVGYPKYLVPYYNRVPKKDHNFDNHPYSPLAAWEDVLRNLLRTRKHTDELGCVAL